MKKHKHYQQIRAYADNWGIEEYDYNTGSWEATINPCFFYYNSKFRIIPDNDGWIPWYPHEDAKCPVDGMVDVKREGYADGVFFNNEGNALYWGISYNARIPSITHYRPHNGTSKRERI